MKNSRLEKAIVLVGLSLVMGLPAVASDEKSNVNDVGNRKVAHRSIISQQKEIAIGKQYSEQIDKTAKLIKDPVVTEYVNRVAQNVARNSDLKVPLTVKIIDDPTINAFALPGGFLYINSGTIKAADEEDQLAGVMAHEMAHVALRHWASNMTKQTILQYATIPLIFVPMTYPVYLAVSEGFNFGVPLAFLHFSRNDEAEADYFGLQYMYKAGYDPNSYVAFFAKVLQEERSTPGSVPKVFADHPPTPDRIVKCEEEIKQIIPKRDQYLVTTSEFSDIKSRLTMVMAENKKLEKPGPTLEKRAKTDSATQSGQSGQGGKKGSSDSDAPPVLKRKDSSQ